MAHITVGFVVEHRHRYRHVLPLFEELVHDVVILIAREDSEFQPGGLGNARQHRQLTHYVAAPVLADYHHSRRPVIRGHQLPKGLRLSRLQLHVGVIFFETRLVYFDAGHVLVVGQSLSIPLRSYHATFLHHNRTSIAEL